MNKKFILLPLVTVGLLAVGCAPKSPSSSSSSSSAEQNLWEMDLVDGESSIAQVKAGTVGEYYKVRGTVAWNSGSTFALYRGGQYLYCYNFSDNVDSTGNTDLKAHALGTYVEVYGKSSEYNDSVQLSAYINGTGYDPDAKCGVVSETKPNGETITPKVASAISDFANAHAGELVKASLVATEDYTIPETLSSNLDKTYKLGTDDVTVRIEKFISADALTTLRAANPTTIEAGATYEVVGVLAAASSGTSRLVIGDSSSWRKTADAHYDDPTAVTVAAAGDATSVEVGATLKLTATVTPATAKQTVTWETSDAAVATVSDAGLVSGVAAGNVTITAKSVKDGVVGTIALTVKSSSLPNLANPVTLDFTTRTETSGVELTETSNPTLLEVLTGATTEADLIASATASKVYSGNGKGGAKNNQAGLLKFSTSKANGSLEITLSKMVNKVVLSGHDFYAASDSYPTTSNKVNINGVEVANPYTAEATPADMVFELSAAASVITINATGRFCLYSITLSYVA